MEDGNKLAELLEAHREFILTNVIQSLSDRIPSVEWEVYLPLFFQHYKRSIVASDIKITERFLIWFSGMIRSHYSEESIPDTLLETFTNHLNTTLNHSDKHHFLSLLNNYRQTMDTLQNEHADEFSWINPDHELGELAQNYFDFLAKGDRNAASLLIHDALESGISIKDIYLHVFKPALYEIGRLWEKNKITIGQEHFFTASTQMIMSQLYPFIFRTERNGHSMVATSIGGELHEIGLRMVSDFFELEGYDTYYLGANIPHNAVLDEVKIRNAHLIAVSVTIASHLDEAEQLIRNIRTTAELKDTLIIVGGYPFNQNPDLWKSIDADFCATDAEQAIQWANQKLSIKAGNEQQ